MIRGNYAGTLESAPITVGKAALTGTLTLSHAEGVITAAVEGAPEGSCDIVWLRDGQPISGAAGTAYTITDEDRGHTISAKLTAKGDYTAGDMADTERKSEKNDGICSTRCLVTTRWSSALGPIASAASAPQPRR